MAAKSAKIVDTSTAGRTVEVIGLCATPDRNDGERLKVAYARFASRIPEALASRSASLSGTSPAP